MLPAATVLLLLLSGASETAEFQEAMEECEQSIAEYEAIRARNEGRRSKPRRQELVASKAHNACLRLTREFPDEPDALASFAIIQALRGRAARAHDLLVRAYAMKVTNKVLYALAIHESERGDLSKSATYWAHLLKRDPDNTKASLAVLVSHRQLKKYDAMFKVFGTCLDSAANVCRCREGRAWAAAGMGHWEVALEETKHLERTCRGAEVIGNFSVDVVLESLLQTGTCTMAERAIANLDHRKRLAEIRPMTMPGWMRSLDIPALKLRARQCHIDHPAGPVTAQVSLMPSLEAAHSLLFVHLTPEGASPKDLTLMRNALMTEFSGIPGLTARSIEDVETTLANEAMKDALGCDDVTCAAEIAGALDVELIAYGSLARIARKFVLSLTVLDSRTVDSVARVHQTVEGNSAQLARLAKRATADVIRSINARAAMGPAGGISSAD